MEGSRGTGLETKRGASQGSTLADHELWGASNFGGVLHQSGWQWGAEEWGGIYKCWDLPGIL